MSSAVSSPPAGRPAKGRLTVSDLVQKQAELPSRVIVHGLPGIGKSSLPAFGPTPVYIMTKLETGIVSLKGSGRVPETVGIFPECKSWRDIFNALAWLEEEEHQFKTVVLDTLNGAEKMCHDYVSERDYNNRMAAFTAYQSGYKVSINDFRELLAAIDKLRELRKMAVFVLAHTKVKNFKNPTGADFDRYMPDLHDETWSVTHGWADMVLFANFETDTRKDSTTGGKVKGVGVGRRLLFTTWNAAWDAKHRHGLPEVISMGESGKEAWANLAKAIADGRKGGAA